MWLPGYLTSVSVSRVLWSWMVQSAWSCAVTLTEYDLRNLERAGGHSWEEKSESKGG